MNKESEDQVTLESMTELVRQRAEGREFPYTVKFLFLNVGCLHVDGAHGPPVITNQDDPAQVTLKMTLSNFSKMFSKEISAQRAAMTGKIKFEGNVGIAMKLGSLLD
jgi:putative sterol carrier protein